MAHEISCAQPATPGWVDFAQRVDSPNFGLRPEPAETYLIVIHNISLPPGEFGGEAVKALFTNTLDPESHPSFAELADLRVSAHFYIQRQGQTFQFVSTQHRAWHAGQSVWQGKENCNDYSIGIELEGCDTQAFTPEQYTHLLRLIDDLRQKYPIRAIAGHEHIAPGRKTDPGPHFNWPLLVQRYPELRFPESVTA